MEASKAAELNQRGVELAKQKKLHEAVELFQKAVRADPNFGLACRNLGHAYLELALPEEAIRWYERTIKLDPRSVESLNNLGMLRSQKGDFSAAINVLRSAVTIAPDYAPAWNNLGIALAAARRHMEAVEAFRRGLALEPNHPEMNSNLGLSLVENGWPDEALHFIKRALELKPDYIDARRNLAVALGDLGQIDEALNEYEQALALKPKTAEEIETNRSQLLLLKGDFEAGWRAYEHRFKKAENVRVQHDAPRWDGSPLSGRTLLLEAEQGMGDTIQFVRLAAKVKQQHSGRIILAVEAKLLALLAGVDGVDLIVPQDQPRPRFDVWLPLLSLAGLLKTTPESAAIGAPYLKANEANVEKWRRELTGIRGLKIGIAWQGNPWNKADKSRSFKLTEFAPLAKLHGLTLISLQKGPGSEQLDALTQFDVVRLPDELDRGAALFDTAAVMKNLDLVISTDTSLAHLAGALGVPVWVPLSFVSDWRWGRDGEHTPWYFSMRLFRQTKLRDWAGVFDRIRTALLKTFPRLRPRLPNEFVVATSGFNRLAYTRHGPLIYNRHDTVLGNSLAELGEYAQSEVEVFRQCVRPGATVVEAGANVGAHTIALAKRVGPAGAIHAIEPQRLLFQTLAGNMALSSLTQVHCHHAAVGDKEGTILVPTFDFSKPNHFGALELGRYEAGERVRLMTIDSLQLPRCDFMKIDVSGMELEAIRGARETLARLRPILYVAADRLENAPAVIEQLFATGYKLYWHVPRYFDAANYYGNDNNSLGNLAALNILGVHESIPTDLAGLAPITSPQSDWRNP